MQTSSSCENSLPHAVKLPSPAEPKETPVILVEELSTPVEFMRFCPVCQSEQRFFADRYCAEGLIGGCVNCLTEGIAVFTRTNSEVA